MKRAHWRTAFGIVVGTSVAGIVAACGVDPVDSTREAVAAPDASSDSTADASIVDAARDASDAAIVDAAPSSDASKDTSVPADAADAMVDASDAATDAAADVKPNVCGDGVRDPSSEECDDGPSGNGASAPCSATCVVQDFAAVAAVAGDAGALERPTRTLGHGRHPLATGSDGFALAFLNEGAVGTSLRVEAFDLGGTRRRSFPSVGVPALLSETSDPVLAALPGHTYAAVWTDHGGDGDAEGVAMTILDTSTGLMGAVAHANTTTSFGQDAADAIWVNGALVVAWVDASSASTGPDLSWRTFDANLHPTSGEMALARTPAIEADVTLAPFNGTWAAAWRSVSNGVETVHVASGGKEIVVGASSPGPANERPALAQVGPSTLQVTFTSTFDPGDAGPTSSKLMQATIDMAATALTVVPTELVTSAYPAASPASTFAAGSLWTASWTGAHAGDPNADELWLQASAGIVPLPRSAAHRSGDQRNPALAASLLAPSGALVAAWEDHAAGSSSAAPIADVLIEVIPLPTSRLAGHP